MPQTLKQNKFKFFSICSSFADLIERPLNCSNKYNLCLFKTIPERMCITPISSQTWGVININVT